jgi:hypothetical protein
VFLGLLIVLFLNFGIPVSIAITSPQQVASEHFFSKQNSHCFEGAHKLGGQTTFLNGIALHDRGKSCNRKDSY